MEEELYNCENSRVKGEVFVQVECQKCTCFLSWNAQFPWCCQNEQLIGPRMDSPAESGATRMKRHPPWLELPAMLLPCLQKAVNRTPVAGEASYVFLCSEIFPPSPKDNMSTILSSS